MSFGRGIFYGVSMDTRLYSRVFRKGSEFLGLEENMGIGPTQLIIILFIIVLLFGVKKLPQLGKSLGEGISNFKKGLKEGNEKDE